MALIKCPECAKDMSDAATACPHCGRPNAAAPTKTEQKQSSTYGVGCLIIIIIVGLVVLGNLGDRQSESPSERSSRSNALPEQPVGPKLELVALSWHRSYDYAIMEGQVRNITNGSLKNVTAVASFTDGSDSFVTSSDALIDYNPILPGQVSPFKVMARWNPAMKRAGIEFKFLMGGTIDHREQEKPKKTKKKQ